METDDDRLRERAYQIWEREGKPDGRHEDHWQRARRELEADDMLRKGEVEPWEDVYPVPAAEAGGPAVEEIYQASRDMPGASGETIPTGKPGRRRS